MMSVKAKNFYSGHCASFTVEALDTCGLDDDSLGCCF